MSTTHTLCGYGWGDVNSAFLKAVSAGDMARAQRWAAELVCTEGGLGRLEAIMLHAWSLSVGAANAPGWPLAWIRNIQHIRTIWARSGGDVRAVRNTPSVRQSVAEGVAWLVLAPKAGLPALPKSEDCFRESETMRARLRSGGGAGDQACVRRIWAVGQDGHDLKTIGNEFEAALRSNNIPRMLFWLIWLITLDSTKDCPTVKERAPPEITGKQRKSVLWFLWAVLKDFTEESKALNPQEMEALYDLVAVTWLKLGAKGRRDVFASIALFLQEKCQKSLSILGAKPPPPQPASGMRTAVSLIDEIYIEIAEEAKRFVAETPHITELTPEAARVAAATAEHKRVKQMTSLDKLNIAFNMIQENIMGRNDGT